MKYKYRKQNFSRGIIELPQNSIVLNAKEWSDPLGNDNSEIYRINISWLEPIKE